MQSELLTPPAPFQNCVKIQKKKKNYMWGEDNFPNNDVGIVLNVLVILFFDQYMHFSFTINALKFWMIVYQPKEGSMGFSHLGFVCISF